MAKMKRNGEYLYLFNWVDGGFNDVWAPNMKEARRRVAQEQKDHKKKYPDSVILKAAPKSFRKANYKQYEAQNRMGWMMSL